MGNAVANSKTRVDTVRAMVERSKSQFAMALPHHVDIDRFLRVAMTAIQRNSDLLECTPMSLVAAMMQSAQLGLEIDGVLGHSYLIPFELKNGTKVAQFIPGYRGLVDLARRSGCVSTITAACVYEKDQFTYELGAEPKLVHKPAVGNRGKLIYAYAVAVLRDDGKQFEVMSRAEIDHVRKSSRAKKGPWFDHFDEMCRKSVLRRLCKLLPMSVETQQAFEIDERTSDARHEPGPAFDVDFAPVDEGVDEVPDDDANQEAAGHDGQPVEGETEEVLAEAHKQIAAATSIVDLQKIVGFFKRDDVSALCETRAEEIRGGRGERANMKN